MKKIISISLFMFLMISLLSACSSVKEKESSEFSTIYYIEEEGIIGIMGFKNEKDDSLNSLKTKEKEDWKELKDLIKEYKIENAYDIEIPQSINGVSVKAIDGGAFNKCESIKSIKIPDSVTIIESGAFDGCSKDLVIIGTNNSAAYKYADKSGIDFQVG